MSSTIAAPVNWVEAVGKLHFPSKADRRLQELMDCNNEGLLDQWEREELEALVELSEQLSVVRGEALQILGKRPYMSVLEALSRAVRSRGHGRCPYWFVRESVPGASCRVL